MFVMPSTNLDTFFGHEFSFRAISTFEIRKIVLSFSSNSPRAPTIKVSMKVIKNALPCILPTLTEIINCSLLTSVFPSIWNEAEVIGLLKGNRPVTLLTAISQICERVALDQLTDYFVSYKALVKTLKWKINSHSTETLNIFITDILYWK